MTERTRASWPVYALAALCAGAIAAAILLVGPASGSPASVTRTATVARGVVQSTVSGSGNLQAASQLNLGFKTSGTVTHIYVSQGQHVVQGQLLATLDPQSAEVALQQAKATLQSSEANLAKEEETDGEGSTGAAGASASAASVSDTSASQATIAAATSAYTSAEPSATTPPTSTTPAASTPTATTTTPIAATPTTTTPTATTPAATAPSTGEGEGKGKGESKSKANSEGGASAHENASESDAAGSSSQSSTSTLSAATRQANLASARAAVKSDSLTVQSEEQAVQNTRLYAPESGTIVSLSGQVGEVVSGSGTTKAAAGASSSSGSGTSGAGTGAAAARSATSATSSSSSSSASSAGSSFAVLSDLSSMQLAVALSESEIGNVRDGQIATVTVEALEGRKLAAHVSEVALLSTSSSGAVSYDVTFQLDQLAPGLRLGMSATAEVVVKQAEGLNVPTSAITGGAVTVERGGKQVRRRVLTGLAGDTSTIIVSGLKAGETVVLPAASSASSSASGVLSRLGSRLGGLGAGTGLGGGAGFPAGGGGGGGGAFFRGGG